MYSLMPVKQADHAKLQLPRELYGPTMLVFTLIALLLYQMKTADHRVVRAVLTCTLLLNFFFLIVETTLGCFI